MTDEQVRELLKKYGHHWSFCNKMQDWSEAQEALSLCPNGRDKDQAYIELYSKMNECTCGLDSILNAPEPTVEVGFYCRGWEKHSCICEEQCATCKKATWMPALPQPIGEEGWISVEDRLPEVGEFVLVYNTEGATLTGRLMRNGWVASFLDGEKLMRELTATHWRELPPPPKEQSPIKD
jgi:hypothetical protein